jgi:hypothetical protein
MLISAILRVYSPIFFGAAGWILTALVLPFLWKQWKDFNVILKQTDRWNWILLFGLVAAVFLYIAFPNDCIRGGTDMGTYTNTGIYLSHHGRYDAEYPYPQNLETVFRKNTLGKRLFYRGVYHTGTTITFQFAQAFPLWLAQMFASLGYSGLSGFNGLITLLSLGLFYALCRKFTRAPFAVVATFFLAFNPSQLWMARVTMTEIPAQFFILAGVLLLSVALRETRKGLGRWAGLLLGLSPLIRIDNFLLLPLLFAAHLTSKILADRNQKDIGAVWLSFYQICFPLFLISTLYYVIFSLPYFRAMSDRLETIGWAALVTLFFLVISNKKILVPVRSIFRLLSTQIVLGFSLFSLTIYAYWLRPLTKSHALFNYPGQPVHGTRTFEEFSLVYLSEYLTPFVVFVGVLGLMIILIITIRSEKIRPYLPFLFIFCGFSLFYLWKPHIESIHFWWVRRFVPVVIPGFILCAAVGSEWLLNRLKSRLSKIFSLVVILFLIVFTLKADFFMLFFAENKGYYGQLKEVSDYLPKDELILGHDALDDSEWITPLFLSFDRKVYPVNINTDTGLKIWEKWLAWQRKRSLPGYFIYEGKSLGLPGAVEVKTFELSKSYIQKEEIPLPEKIVSGTRILTLFKVQDFSTSYLDMNLGGQQVLGVKESGFYGQEWLGSKLVRWTNGSGKLVVPLGKESKPKYLFIAIESLGSGKRTLEVKVNGVEVLEEFISHGPWSDSIDISHIEMDKSLVIEILSDVFIPADVIDGSEDRRRLGVFVSSIRLSERAHRF